jgi:hypothetical protein
LGYELDAILGRLQWLFWDGDDDTGTLLAQILASGTGATVPPPPPPMATSRKVPEPVEPTQAASPLPAASKPAPAQVAKAGERGFAVNIGSARDIDFGGRRPR